MKTILKSLLFMVLLAVSAQASHVWKGTLVNETGLAYNNSYVLDTTNLGLNTLTWQAVYATHTFTNATFTDGTTSTNTITVVSTATLGGIAGTATLTVSTNSLIPTNAQILFNGYQLNNAPDGDWQIGASSAATAISIAGAFNAHAAYFGVTASTTSINVVTLTCASVGAFCNNNTLSVNTSTSAIKASGANMTGGQDNAQVCINGKCLVYGTDWTLGVSSTVTTTALTIASATTNSPLLAGIVTSTNVAGVVYSTSTGVGLSANYSLVCRPSAALTCPPAYKGGTNSADITTNGALQILNNGFTKALPVLFSKTAGTPPQDLVVGTTYYAVPVDANNLKLASTSAKAAAGTADIRLSTQAVTGGGSYTLAPLAYSGNASWKWQVSADNVNWSDLTTNPNNISVSSTTFLSPFTATNATYDLGPANYTFYRLNVVGPTQGGVALTVTGSGKQSRVP